MRKNPSYTALLRPTRLLISEKSATYMIKWSYTIIWQVRVGVSAVISSDFPCLRTFAASLTSTASNTTVASMTSTACFHQKILILMVE
jgi:hypothetical protein